MTNNTFPKTVEHRGRQPERESKGHATGTTTTPLPWEAPAGFNNVPAHAGPLRARKPVGWSAINDAEAVAVWLAERASASVNTAQAYRKEIERFLFWLSDQGMTISDAMREDYLRYGRFLLNPLPADKWCSGKRFKRDASGWRPFEKALTPNSAMHSLTVVRSLIHYLHERGWLSANSMPNVKHLVATQSISRADEIFSRQISSDLMGSMEEFVDTYGDTQKDSSLIFSPEDKRKDRQSRFIRSRARVIIALSGVLGARSSDLTNGYLNEFVPAPPEMSVEWLWHIPSGKGRKSATLPVPPKVMDKIANMRILLGLPAYPQIDEPPYPIVPDARAISGAGQLAVESIKPISRSGLYRHTQTLFHAFADTLESEGYSANARIMREASAHWLRHTAIKSILTSTGSLTTAQKLGRHSNVNTTAEYGKATLDELAGALTSHTGSKR